MPGPEAEKVLLVEGEDDRQVIEQLRRSVQLPDFSPQVTGTVGKLIDAIGHALEEPSPNSKGKIPDRILEQTRFDPVSTYSGSFGIRLESHAIDHYGNALVRRSLENLFAILGNDDRETKDNSPAIAFATLAESAHSATSGYRLYHSSRRVTASMREFLSVVEGALEAVTLTWITPDPGEPRRVRISREQAKQMRLLNEHLAGNHYASAEQFLAESTSRSD